jgi:hypothetical protein
MNEVWKDIPNYEGIYQASNLGRIKSLNPRNTKIEVIRKLRINIHGYYKVDLFKDGKRKYYQVHQVIAMTFLNHKPCKHKIVIDHINNIRTDNRVENLQIVTQRFNVAKSIKNKSSKYTGVSWYKKYNSWVSKIHHKGKQIHLGYFKDEYEAHLTYEKERKKLEL